MVSVNVDRCIVLECVKVRVIVIVEVYLNVGYSEVICFYLFWKLLNLEVVVFGYFISECLFRGV